MKKRMRGLSLVLVLVLVLTLALPALAAGEEAAEGPLTRGEFLQAFFQTIETEEMEPKQAYYEDVPMHGDLALAVRWAVQQGVINGYGNGKFGPEDPITREQLAAMIYRYAQTLGKGYQDAWMFNLDYPDATGISPWANEAMHYVVMNGILTGSEEGIFPKGTVSPEELPAILAQFQKAVIGTDADLVLKNAGLTFSVPGDTADLLVAEAPENAEDGTLFSFSEKASIEAAEALGEETDGAGWLFSIRKVSEDALQELLCSDMSGVEPFAKDAEGGYYLTCHPTDVRLVREDGYTDEALAQWSSLCEWAAVAPRFFAEENGLEPFHRGNTEPEIWLNQILAGKLTDYCFYALRPFDPLEPGDVDPAPFISRLLDGEITFDYSGEGAPDGEYVVLRLPEENVRIDFFFAEGKQNYIRTVAELEDTTIENVYVAEFADEETTANGIVYAWYKAIAEAQGYSLEQDVVLTNGGLTLTVPADKAELLIAETPEDDEFGTLFSLTEIASVEAARAMDEYYDGAGWLFGIRKVSGEALQDMLCYDMSGMYPFAKDDNGGYYLFCEPTDVRVVREDGYTEETLADWSALCAWADSVRESFIDENSLEPFTAGNTEPEIALNRILCGLEPYTVSTLEFLALEPGDVDPAPFVKQLLEGVYTYTDEESPDGEYVVLTLTDLNTRFDFFFAPDGQNLIREVITLDDFTSEVLFKAEFADGETTANGIMSAWYDALAVAQGLK